jgi:hypothetical protein
MGLEDVTSYFHLGLAESARPNPVSRRGIPTHLSLKAGSPLAVNYIMAVAAIPKKWDRVKTIRRGPQCVTLHPTFGSEVRVPLDPGFLYSKTP